MHCAVTDFRDISFTDYMDKWLELVKASVAKSTLAGYRNCIKKIKEYFEPLHIKLVDLKPMHLQEFYNQKLEDGVKAITVHHYHANIHKALKYAVKMEIIPTNPSDKVDLPKKQVFTGSFYSEEEIQKLFNVFQNDECELCVHIAAYYGLRRSEVLGLRWSDINFENGIIEVKNKITEALNENGNYELIIEEKLKTQSSRRTLPLIPHIADMLKSEHKKQQYYKELCGNCYDNDFEGYICRRTMGDIIRPGYFSDHFDWVLKKNGLRKIRLHDLRHTCASLMLKNGVPMKQIQEWLGHSSFATTANCYSHLDYNSKLNSATVIANIYGSNTE